MCGFCLSLTQKRAQKIKNVRISVELSEIRTSIPYYSTSLLEYSCPLCIGCSNIARIRRNFL
ncbi:hypothetical protein Phi19:3_gp054 [Cellulophaga phage phi19:3]|uniref:Uncharacterized protein n=1 Tax=Cellulophaga phage phi19:3 TaxID=1327971 RepID=R9ZZS4_9CAUD|nr:hypothetical protein Phi19:3_gp054 [Cellulophaga phage phi19:3]AGO47458.1 hypothetical protein Phi19:3_gp054 [Cellulophaga phage phi19:3]